MDILDFIVCEDIRQEIGGKCSIVGIYNDTIVLNGLPKDVQWPIALRLGVFVRLLRDETEELPTDFRLKISHEENGVIAAFEGKINGDKAKTRHIVLPLVAPVLPLPAPCHVQLQSVGHTPLRHYDPCHYYH